MFYSNAFIYILISFIFFYCTNYRNSYYSISEGNSLIFQAFAIKDNTCSYTHSISSFFLAPSRKTEVDSCIKAIHLKPCEEWRVKDPTPLNCKGINIRF